MDKIEKVARALAKADGYDPDETVTGEWNADDALEQVYEGEPRWHEYKRDAEKFVVAYEILASQ